MKIFKNFINYEDFDKLQKTMEGPNFVWTYIDGVTKFGDGRFQFVHNFYDEYLPRSDAIGFIQPIIEKIKPTAIVRIKANLLTKTDKIIAHEPHTDFNIADKLEVGTVNKKHRSHTSVKGMVTGVYYINTCNGYTQIGKKKIHSEENKLVLFDSSTYHSGTTCTDQNRRIVINFNYYP